MKVPECFMKWFESLNQKETNEVLHWIDAGAPINLDEAIEKSLQKFPKLALFWHKEER